MATETSKASSSKEPTAPPANAKGVAARKAKRARVQEEVTKVLEVEPLEAEEEAEAVAENFPEWQDYAVSIAGSQRLRRLHRVGSCHRIPSVHYSRFTGYGKSLPTPDRYDWICLDCWPRGTQSGDIEEEPQGEVSSSSESGEEKVPKMQSEQPANRQETD